MKSAAEITRQFLATDPFYLVTGPACVLFVIYLGIFFNVERRRNLNPGERVQFWDEGRYWLKCFVTDLFVGLPIYCVVILMASKEATMNFFALAAYLPYTLCVGYTLAQEIALFDAQESRRIDTVEFGTKWFIVRVVALVVVLAIWGERFLASQNKSPRDIDIAFSGYALLLMLFRRCAWKMQLQNLKSNDLIMRLAVSILLLAAALAGFYYLDLKKAILWFLFLLVA